MLDFELFDPAVTANKRHGTGQTGGLVVDRSADWLPGFWVNVFAHGFG